MKNLNMETGAGDYINTVAQKAKDLAIQTGKTVEFNFNEITCLVNKDTNTELLVRDYGNAHIMDWKTVGPNCDYEYSNDIQIDLYSRKLERAKKRETEQELYNKKCEEEKKLVTDKIAGTKISIIPEKQADYNKYVETNSKNGYSKAVVEYAETWACLMQVEIAKGKTVKECADKTQKPLGYLGITGFQYGCAVQSLAEFWVHGENLRKWHNKKYGVSEDKKRVVNPAVLTIGRP